MISNREYLDDLNSAQQEAVCYTDGPSLVIAGAGSGKTRVLTYKIVHLLCNGYEPYRIMALTFTNKAAREMKERVAALVGNEIASKLWMGTFHSIFLRILRRHASLLGYKPDFTIYDAADSRSLIKLIIKDLSLDEKQYKPNTVASIISMAKNELVPPRQYALDADRMKYDSNAGRPMMSRIYSIYNERCKCAGAMDFDDILFNMNTLLRDNPDILRHYAEFFQYILVDEYQDTNFAQNLIVSQLSKVTRQLCVVGDDAQSIYSFRGANIANILRMNTRYPDLKIFKLERNYRSTQSIVNAAGSLIAKNNGQIAKNVYSENKEGEPIDVLETYSDMEEAYMVANGISRSSLLHHDTYKHYAVLYRTNAQSRVLEEALRKRNIPYRIYGGVTFYQRKEVKDAIAYFRLTVNPQDDEALRRVINYPARGIGETTVKKIISAAVEHNVSLWEVVCNPKEHHLDINAGTAKKLDMFATLIGGFIADRENGTDAYTLGQNIYNRTGMLAMYGSRTATPEEISKRENLLELLNGLKEFVDTKLEAGEADTSISDFLSEISLATDMDTKVEDEENKVTLMTVHAAKGLEFKHVFIVGLEENLFPSSMASSSISEIEEERRLLYVAITRAMDTCTISYAKSRFRNGETCMTGPSRFLYDINPSYLRFSSSSQIGLPTPPQPKNIEAPRKNYGYPPSRQKLKPISKSTNTQHTSMPFASSSSIGKLSVNARVKHSRFGVGTVMEIITDPETIAVVNFDSVGTKKLILRFAKLEILD
jgi:DNA helicase-2/ATP-dependent DNA helicase PcrA